MLMADERRVQISHTHILRAGSLTPINRVFSTVLPGEAQGPLFWVLQLVRGIVGSLIPPLPLA